jgi:hypothetical protein
MGMKRYRISLTKTLYPVVGGDFYEYEVRPSEMGWWILNYICFDI